MLRREVEELRERTILYHYTSAAGLHGILQSGALRATNYLYLNDTSEIEHGTKIVIGFLRDEAGRQRGELRQLLVEAADRLEQYTRETEPDPILRESAPLDIYIASFCEEPNLLSQWRAYGGAEGRYCIGFDVKSLEGFDIVFPARVIYDTVEQHELLSQTTRSILSITISTMREKQMPTELAKIVPSTIPTRYSSDREVLEDARLGLEFCLDRVLCRLKHPAFREEREWRSIIDLSNYDQTEVLDFDVSGGKVRPYVKRFRGSSSDPDRLPIREVYVGYSRRPAQAKRTVELLLRKFGYRNCEVKLADVPLLE